MMLQVASIGMKLIRRANVLICFASLGAACSSSDAVPGVSLELAQHRAKVLSDVNYELTLEIPAEQGDSIGASVTVEFKLSEVSRSLQLDFRASADHLHSVRVNGEESDYRFTNEHIVIPESELLTGTNQVEIEFTAGDSSLNRNPDYLYTLFVPDRARTAFPVFDQPNIKATYDLTLRVPEDWRAMSNAALANVEYADARISYQFQRTGLISSYLFSFVAGKFEQVTRDIDGRTMTMLHRESDAEKIARNLDEIFELHAASLSWLEDYTGISYPWQKFDFALIPGFQYGGMEHVGAIQYRAGALFLDPAPSEQHLLRRASLIAHETAHMWFGNLVTMEWFNDVWTKEVFASFMASKIVNPSFPDINHDLNFLVGYYPDAYSVDRTEGANPIRQELRNLNEAGQMYGAIIYNKAPIMMRQLEAMIGEDAFRNGIRVYLRRHSFANATWPTLIEILDERTTHDLRAWSETWVNTAGRPEFVVSRPDDGNSLRMDQYDPARENRVWPQRFEVSALSRRQENHVSVVSDEASVIIEPVVSNPDDAVIFNSNGFGYGLFPGTLDNLRAWDRLSDLQKGSELINVYENLLVGASVDVLEYFELLQQIVGKEENVLLLNLAIEQLQNTYWRFVDSETRESLTGPLEALLWNRMLSQANPAKKKILFNVYADISVSPSEVQNVYEIWAGQTIISDLQLAENDFINLAQDLAVKIPERSASILETQKAATHNPDNLRKLDFIAPSLSATDFIRDAFFESLAKEEMRQTETWVLDALRNLHHPLRREYSEKYLRASLELLQEIQITGDIFFPKRWLDVTFGNYQSATAVNTVRNFLDENPNYNAQLRMKILQAADPLFRANRIVDADRSD